MLSCPGRGSWITETIEKAPASGQGLVSSVGTDSHCLVACAPVHEQCEEVIHINFAIVVDVFIALAA